MPTQAPRHSTGRPPHGLLGCAGGSRPCKDSAETLLTFEKYQPQLLRLPMIPKTLAILVLNWVSEQINKRPNVRLQRLQPHESLRLRLREETVYDLLVMPGSGDFLKALVFSRHSSLFEATYYPAARIISSRPASHAHAGPGFISSSS